MCRKGLVVLFLVCLSGVCLAQQNKGNGDEALQEWFEDIALEMAEQGVSDEAVAEALDYFEHLLSSPLNINTAKKEDLERLIVLSDFQIASLLDYRKERGYILSGAELSLLNGFDEQIVNLLRAFIVFEEDNSSGESFFGGNRKAPKGFFSNCNSTLLVKSSRVLKKEEWYEPISKEEYLKKPDSRYLGTPYYTHIKYKCEYKNKIQVGFTMENDAGETFLNPDKIPLSDFLSIHTMFKDLKLGKRENSLRVKSLVLGDYTIKFGQGLTVWNGFSLSGSYTPQGLYKRGAALSPYTSSDENNFYRGGAVSFEKGMNKLGVINFSTFFSIKKVDAKVVDGVYSSFLVDGKHNTLTTLSNRKTLGEVVYGANVNWEFNKIKIGVSWVNYFYDAENGRRVREYNKYQMYNGLYGNFALDFYTIIKKYRLFGECGVDYGGNAAALLGAVGKYKAWEIGSIIRGYSKKYIAPYANAYSTISSCSNQVGGVVSATKMFRKGYQVSFGGDFVHYPWLRFNINEPSSIVKIWGRGDYKAERVSCNFKVYESYTTYKNFNKMGIRGYYGYRLFSFLNLKLRGEFVFTPFMANTDLGYALATDFDMKFFSNRLRIQLRGAYYKCENWNCRLYMYESDLPSSYTSQMFYREGIRWYILTQLKVGRWGNIYIKGDSYPKLKFGIKARF